MTKNQSSSKKSDDPSGIAFYSTPVNIVVAGTKERGPYWRCFLLYLSSFSFSPYDPDLSWDYSLTRR
jgi:hypothetical protein